MANQITKAPAPMLPGMRDETFVRRLVDSFDVHMEGRLAYANRLPNSDERRELQARNVEIVQALRPIKESQDQCMRARVALGLLFGGHPSLAGQDKRELIDAYMFVLNKYPLFAVLAGIDDAINRRLPKQDDRFVPNSPQVGAACARHVETLAREQIKIERVLAAKYLMRKPDAAGAAARVAASLKDFHGRMSPVEGAGVLSDRERKVIAARREKEGQQAVLREWAAIGLSPMTRKDGTPMSVALAKSVGALIEVSDGQNGRWLMPRGELNHDRSAE